MSCEYCSGPRSELVNGIFDGEGVSIDLLLEDGEPRIEAVGEYDGGYLCGVEYVGISYCPMCGRDLREHAE